MVRYQVPLSRPPSLCLLVGAAIGAAQGYWVAYFGIPSFIVTLAGMLVFKGLTLALLQGQSVGPFPPAFQKLVVRLHCRTCCRRHAEPTSLLLGAALTLALVVAGVRGARQREQRMGSRSSLYAFFVAKNGGARGRDPRLHLLIAIAPRIAERAGHHGGPDRALRLRDAANGDRPADLCGRRQRESRQAIRHQGRAADLPRLRQHGRAGRPGRAGLRRPPQHRDAQGRAPASNST